MMKVLYAAERNSTLIMSLTCSQLTTKMPHHDVSPPYRGCVERINKAVTKEHIGHDAVIVTYGSKEPRFGIMSSHALK